jgi:DNA-damage-inducible protein J
MPIITVKVEDSLRNSASAVLEELGLDIPTAVRMYLKSVVRENGLPISTKLEKKPCCDASDLESFEIAEDEKAEEAIEEGDDLVDDVVKEIPAPEEAPAEEPAPAPQAVIDYGTVSGRKAIAALFIDTICSVPAGSLTRWSDMEAALTAKYGTEVTRPQNIRWPAAKQDGTQIPYWRIVGERGAVRGDKMIKQAVQEEKLKDEGLAFVSAGHGTFTGIKVDGYKSKLVKF